MNRLASISPLLFLAACASNGPWHLSSIAAGDPLYDSSRLTYVTPSSHLQVEFLHASEKIEAFLSMDRFTFTGSEQNPGFAEVALQIGGEEWKGLAALRKGNMRAKLSEELASRLISALQEGTEVVIIAGGVQQTLSPELFDELYGKFSKTLTRLSNLFKGPLE